MERLSEYPGQAPCPACFESSGYEWEHGNDWDSGPWSHQTNIPCRHCNGTGTVDSPLATLEDLEDAAADEAEAWECNLGMGCAEYRVCYASSQGRPDMCGRLPRAAARADDEHQRRMEG